MKIENTLYRDTGSSPAQKPLSGAGLIAVTTLGNALEFFDFTVFTFLSLTIGRLFFPTASPYGQLLLSSGTFVVGYFCRPLGGLLIGLYADRAGRKAGMTLTVSLMALSSGLIGIAPTYATIGVLAPCLILLSRVMQGISAGGEVGASTALLIEYAPPHARGFYGSWQFASQGLGSAAGALLSTVLFRVLSADAMITWGWRVPFLVGMLIGPVGYYIRRRVVETLHADATDQRGDSAKAGGLRLLARENLKPLLLGILLTFGGTSANFIILFSVPMMASRTLGIPESDAVLAGIATGLTGIIAGPLGGWVSDRVGRKPVIFCSRLAVILLIAPALMWLFHAPSVVRLLVVEIGLSGCAAFGGATAIGFLPELFPQRVRATGMAVVYSVGVAFSGLSAQLVASWQIGMNHDSMPAAVYVIVCLVLSCLALPGIREPVGRVLGDFH